MPHTQTRSVEPPRKPGWYVVWRRGPDGKEVTGVYHCIPVNAYGDMGCAAATGEQEGFTPVTSSFFARAFWQGPFRTRQEAATILEHL